MKSHGSSGQAPQPEFSRILDVDELTGKAHKETIEATEEERKALAERFELVDIPAFKADVSVKKQGGGQLYTVTGHITADVVQTCVVSLEPVPAHIDEEFEAFFTDPGSIQTIANDIEIDAEDDEGMPEPVVDGKLDIGELSAQYLSLALEPYPHAPGTQIPEDGTVWKEDDGDDDGNGGKPNPFAVLKDFRK